MNTIQLPAGILERIALATKEALDKAVELGRNGYLEHSREKGGLAVVPDFVDVNAEDEVYMFFDTVVTCGRVLFGAGLYDDFIDTCMTVEVDSETRMFSLVPEEWGVIMIDHHEAKGDRITIKTIDLRGDQ